jgi:hypothetical protein
MCEVCGDPTHKVEDDPESPTTGGPIEDCGLVTSEAR